MAKFSKFFLDLQEVFNLTDEQLKVLQGMLKGDIDRWQYVAEHGLDIQAADRMDGPDLFLEIVNLWGKGYGVEALRGEWHDRYYQDIQALYVNTGDTYSATVLFDTVKGKYRVTTWGDFVEAHPSRFPEQ